jgi:hypothetical protein
MGGGVTNLLDAREKLAALLAPAADDDPSVLTALVDSLEPPALMIGWAEPSLTPTGPCNYLGRLVVSAVSGRLVPGAGVAALEELKAYTLGRLRAGGGFVVETVGGDRVFPIGGVSYLAARITVRTVITL